MEANVKIRTEDEPAGLRWTGHPLVDAGIAGITVWLDRESPEQINYGDLDRFVGWASRAVVNPALGSFVSVLFTINGYLNPSFPPERKTQEALAVMRGYLSHADSALPACAYCGRPSWSVVSRDQAPMLTGRGVVNFFPAGRPGLPVCGLCVLSLQGLIVGSMNCSGRALVVSTPSQALLTEIARRWWKETSAEVHLYLQKQEKMPGARGPRSRVIEVLAAISRQQRSHAGRSSGLVAYHLSNSGQGPSADVYPLAGLVVGFVQRAQLETYRPVWQALARRGYLLNNKNKEVSETEQRTTNNRFYDSLYRLPDDASPFVRQHLLAPVRAIVEPLAPKAQAQRKTKRESPETPEPLVSGPSPDQYWRFTEMFLKEVMNMQPERIAAIRMLSEDLAKDIAEDNDRRLFQRAVTARNYYDVRQTILRADGVRIRRGNGPLLSLDGFLLVFDEGEELPRADWRLAWDLTLLGLYQSLYDLHWFDKNVGILAETGVLDDQEGNAE